MIPSSLAGLFLNVAPQSQPEGLFLSPSLSPPYFPYSCRHVVESPEGFQQKIMVFMSNPVEASHLFNEEVD